MPVRDDRVEDLLELVSIDPRRARASAEARLAADDPADLRTTAMLRWVVGLAERELGSLDAADTALELAGVLAVEAGADEVAASIQSSRAFIVARLGRLDDAIGMLREAEPRTSGPEHARLTGQLGTVLFWRGDLAEAAAQLTTCCDELARYGDSLGEARYRANLGGVWGQLGRYASARQSLSTAIQLAERAGLDIVVGTARQNLGFLAALQGDLPGAFHEYAEAEARFERAAAHANLPRLFADHAQALADAALFGDAESYLDRAFVLFRMQGQETEMAGGMLTAAEIHLANGDVDRAITVAENAARLFRRQNRERWAIVAGSLARQARVRQPDPPHDMAAQLSADSVSLKAHGWMAEALRARLVAAKLLAEHGASPAAVLDGSTRRAALAGRASDQILLRHIDAIAAVSAGNRRAARRAISGGLAIAMSSQATLGSIETRAHAAVHGFALTEVGARLAIADGRPRELLERIEATRLMTSRMPALRPPDDPEMAAMLTELRRLEGTIADLSSSEDDRDHAEHERVRLERNVRRRSRALRGDASPAVGVRKELGSALAMLGGRQLLAHAALDGQLYAVSVVERRARLHDLGPVEGVSERIDGIAFALNRLNRSQGSEASRTAAAEMLYAMADELTDLLLPSVIVDSMDPVVIVPTSVLHDVPWGLLPPLGGRAVSIDPSVSAWARAYRTREERGTSRPGPRSVGFMAGPGLEFADMEVKHLAAVYPDPEVFTGPEATGAACVELLGRADLVHIACHGSFRTDNPMFSSLLLADGPLIVHDLEHLERLPETVVLPACSVASAKALQGGSLLGLATALITLGACNVIAPLTPINDASAVTVMQRLHHELVLGVPPATGLAAAAMSHDLADPTAAAFITLGA